MLFLSIVADNSSLHSLITLSGPEIFGSPNPRGSSSYSLRIACRKTLSSTILLLYSTRHTTAPFSTVGSNLS